MASLPCEEYIKFAAYYKLQIYNLMPFFKSNNNNHPNQTLTIKTLCIIILISLCLNEVSNQNISICDTFWFQGVYYNLNTNFTNQNQKGKDKDNYDIIYNYCQQVQYYCQPIHKVVHGSLIKIYGIQSCYQYTQSNVSLIDTTNISKGIKLQYTLTDPNAPNSINKTLILSYECQGTGIGCPDVELSTIFTFFQDNQLGFFITLQIIGILFMLLGLYIYRASIVLLGACTMFFILLAIQVPIVFYPGVPSEFVSNILIISGICSFFAGYVFGYFPKLGIFMLGCWIGLIISLTLNNVAFYYIKSNPANLTLWIVMPILCVLFGVLSLFIKRTFIIFATSLIGAYMCLRALSWYLGAFPNEFLLARKFHLGLAGPVSWKFYLYVISLIILTASSSALQYWLFNKRSEITNKSKDIDEEFGNMEAQMKAQRQNFVEIANFKQIFQAGKKSRAPKILKRSQPSEEQDEQSQQKKDDQELEDLDQPSQQKPAISKKQLHKRFIIK